MPYTLDVIHDMLGTLSAKSGVPQDLYPDALARGARSSAVRAADS
jgi:hypothetical protein